MSTKLEPADITHNLLGRIQKKIPRHGLGDRWVKMRSRVSTRPRPGGGGSRVRALKAVGVSPSLIQRLRC
eukprot:1089508-Pelagomonas_calceolata.AAC.1